MIARDTSQAAADRQLAIYRAMSPARRGELALEMSVAARELALAGVRHRHPLYSTEEQQFALFRLLLGDELFRRAWPQAPLLAP
ncbi:MAG: hypothetical protein M4D80_08465 [Myxococcota bacterium]|nr:hypothetical protein [Myxococcota bacterium]